MAEIPKGLKKRWETFGKASKYCWEREDVKEALEAGETGKAFELFSSCMKEAASKGIHLLTTSQAQICEAMGREVSAHPICVLAKQAKGISKSEAEKQCKAEGHFHPISALLCEVFLKEKEGE